jgi:hypothetical protein
MTEIIEPPRDEVLVECSSLSSGERGDLETFLAAQPEVQRIARRMRTTDAAPRGDILGLLLPHIDLVVHFGKDALLFLVKNGAAAFIGAKVNDWARARKARSGREEPKEEDSELVPILGPDGRTVKIVRRKKN